MDGRKDKGDDGVSSLPPTKRRRRNEDLRTRARRIGRGDVCEACEMRFVIGRKGLGSTSSNPARRHLLRRTTDRRRPAWVDRRWRNFPRKGPSVLQPHETKSHVRTSCPTHSMRIDRMLALEHVATQGAKDMHAWQWFDPSVETPQARTSLPSIGHPTISISHARYKAIVIDFHRTQPRV